MNESPEARNRRRWINLGELIALAALAVSAVGVWVAWKGGDKDGPSRVVEQRQPIPLALHAKREDDGRRLEISPVESSHSLESLKLTLSGASPIDVGSDGELSAETVEAALKGHDQDPKDRTLSMPVRVEAHYVEAGNERRANGTYMLRYMWKHGGLFGGRSLHLVGLSRG